MKKKRIIYSLLILGFGCLIVVSSMGSKPKSIDLGSEWKPVKDLFGLVDQGWTHTANQKISASLMKHSNSKNLAPNGKLEQTKFISEFTRGRRALLMFQKIDDWKVSSFNFEKDKHWSIMRINGEYTDSFNERVRFQEMHMWKEKKYNVISLIFPVNSNFNNSNEADLTISKLKISLNGEIQ